MITLVEDLQAPKNSMGEFVNVSIRVLNYMRDMINKETHFSDYIICSSTIAGTKKTIRPFHQNLFIREPDIFLREYNELSKIFNYLKGGQRVFEKNQYDIVDKVIYTIQQSIGIGLDLLVEPNSSRKHVGNRFEELIRIILQTIAIPMKKVILNIPYDTDEGVKYYKCETDVVISPYKNVKSNAKDIDPDEIVISLKTTTKDRMPKIFIDKLLMERFLGHPVRILGISQNDIQRKDDTKEPKISYTFVSNLFMVYTKFLTELEGYYYLDVPKVAKQAPFNNYIFPFSKLILNDIWGFLYS
ncbi:MAG TPA: hypothetical protein PLP19_03190 [bacterium]|nr:hypothetical protein [bacterium]HPN42473.1 hypothetical protein [bacterium]